MLTKKTTNALLAMMTAIEEDEVSEEFNDDSGETKPLSAVLLNQVTEEDYELHQQLQHLDDMRYMQDLLNITPGRICYE